MHHYRATLFVKLTIIVAFLVACTFLNSPHAHAAFTVTQYPVPTPSSQPNALVLGPDGNFWFPEHEGNKIGKITPTGTITEYPLPPGSGPSQMAVGPDGNIWFTQVDSKKIGKITMEGAVTEYDVSASGLEPSWIAAGPDGNMWFTQWPSGVAKITIEGVLTEYSTPGRTGRITAGPDGNLWYSSLGVINTVPDTINKITPSGMVTEYSLANDATPTSITTGPDGNIWFTETEVNKIGKLTPSGVLTEYDVPSDSLMSYPFGISLGPDGNLWFSQSNEIGRITTDGVITEYYIDINSMETPFPNEFILMPGNTLWFASAPFNEIVVMSGWVPADSEPAPDPDPTPSPPSLPLVPIIKTTASASPSPLFRNLQTNNTAAPAVPVAASLPPSNTEPDTETPAAKIQNREQKIIAARTNKLTVSLLALFVVGFLLLLRRFYIARHTSQDR